MYNSLDGRNNTMTDEGKYHLFIHTDAMSPEHDALDSLCGVSGLKLGETIVHVIWTNLFSNHEDLICGDCLDHPDYALHLLANCGQ